MQTSDTERAPDAVRADALVRRLAASSALRLRRFELLPVNGPGAPTSRPQGRRPGPVTSHTGLADLISSIATAGLLSPILVEEQPLQDATALRLIVAGERRVMSIRRGATAAPDNPHFAKIPAIVCPGPLTEEERRSWQLIENLAREDLQPGELGAALLFERCAVLSAELEQAGAVVAPELLDEPDPVARYQALQALRARHPHVGASWQVVLRRLGLQLSPRKARAVAAAVTTLPREMSEEMDQHKVALYTRLQLLTVGTGHGDVAADLWQAVKARGRADLLGAAVRAHRAGIVDAESAAEAADVVRAAGNAARSEALRRPATATADEQPAAAALNEPAAPAASATASTAEPVQVAAGPSAPAADTTPSAAVVPETAVGGALTGLRDLVSHLSQGGQLHRFDAGSLRLLVTQLLHHLDGLDKTAPRPADRTEARAA